MIKKHILYNGKWIADIRNNSFAEGQHNHIYLPGQDKVDSGGTEWGLKNIEQSIALSGINSVGTRDPLSLYDSTDHFKNNVTTCAPKLRYESGEIQNIIGYGESVLKAGGIGTTKVSLGGYGGAQQANVNPGFLQSLSSMVWIAMGPGTGSNTAKNIADAKVPCWFIVTEGDDNAGTHDEVTYSLHEAIKAAGGISFLTVFKMGYFDNPHVIQGVLVNGWDSFYSKPGWSSKNQIIPTMSIYEWHLSNKKGSPVVPPNGVFKNLYSSSSTPASTTPEKTRVKSIEFYSDNTFKEIQG